MKNILFSATVASLLLAGCSNEEVLTEVDNQEMYTLVLNMGSDSRTNISEDGICRWNGVNEEEIFVTSIDGFTKGILKCITIEDDGKRAVFSGRITGDAKNLKWMVYPAPKDGVIRMDEITANKHNAPMTGSIQNGVVSNVNYACGLIKLDVKGVNNIKVGVQNKTRGSYTFNKENGELVFTPAQDGDNIAVNGLRSEGAIVYIPVATTSTDTTEPVNVNVYLGGNSTPETITNVDVKVRGIAVDTNSFEVDGQGNVTKDVLIEDVVGLNQAFTNGGKYKLIANLAGTFILNNSANVVELDLNGKSIECDNSDVFKVEAGKLILEGNGTVYAAKENYSSGSAVWVCGQDPANATAIINGGTFKVGDDERPESIGNKNSRNDCIYLGTTVEGKESYGGKIYINGGEFKYCGEEANEGIRTNNGHNFLVNQANQINSKCIFISGGKFYKFDPANAFTDDTWMYVGGVNKPGSYLVDGFGVFENKNTGYFEVVEK